MSHNLKNNLILDKKDILSMEMQKQKWTDVSVPDTTTTVYEALHNRRMVWKFDERESSMQGMLTPVGAFTPLDTRPHVNNVNIVVGTTDDVVWPRLYMSMRYHRHVRESILKYYVIPLMLFSMLVVAPLGDDVGEIMATGSTLVLACIALIFTSDTRGEITFQELNVIISLYRLVKLQKA